MVSKGPIFLRVWCFSIYEKILYEQGARAVKCRGMFIPLVRDYEKLSDVQKIQAIKKESESFVSSCVNQAAQIKNSGVLKTLHKDRAAMNQQNKRDKEEFEGHTIADPHKALPGELFKCRFVYLIFWNISAYYEDSETIALDAAIINAASNEEIRIDGNTLSKWNEHVLISLQIKNPHRIEVWTGMTKQEFLLALKENDKVFYPYRTASEDDIEHGDDVQFDQNIAYRY